MHATLRKLSGLAVLAALVCVPASAQQQSSQQSGSSDAVADAAKKAREQKKDAPKPKKVYTDDDISTKKSDISVVGPAPVPAPAADATTALSTASSTAQAPPPDGSKPSDANSEKVWRARFAALRTKIATAEQELDVLQREESKSGVQYYADPTKAMKEQLTRDEINTKAAKIEAKKKQIADLKQQWSDTEDALRQAGGDPGWSRE